MYVTWTIPTSWRKDIITLIIVSIFFFCVIATSICKKWLSINWLFFSCKLFLTSVEITMPSFPFPFFFFFSVSLQWCRLNWGTGNQSAFLILFYYLLTIFLFLLIIKNNIKEHVIWYWILSSKIEQQLPNLCLVLLHNHTV